MFYNKNKHTFTVNGESFKTLAAIARKYKINQVTLRSHYQRRSNLGYFFTTNNLRINISQN